MEKIKQKMRIAHLLSSLLLLSPTYLVILHLHFLSFPEIDKIRFIHVDLNVEGVEATSKTDAIKKGKIINLLLFAMLVVLFKIMTVILCDQNSHFKLLNE